MFKYLMLLERRSGIQHDEFVKFIENDYLAGQKTCLPYVKTRRLNFLKPNGGVIAAHIADIPPTPAYDVILENWVEDGDVSRLRRDSSDSKLHAKLQSVEGGRVHEGSRAVAVEQRETATRDLGSAAGAIDNGSMIKQIANIKALPGMPYPEFLAYYESQHATMAARLLPTFAKYVRNFVLPDPILQAELNCGKVPLHEFDVMTHMWFTDTASYAEFGRSFAKPEIARAFAEDEAKLFDRKAIQIFNVEERLR